MKKKENNTTGSVLVVLVIIISVLTTLGAGLLNITLSQLEIKKSYSEIKKTLYLSENGLNDSYVKIHELICEATVDSVNKADEYLLENEGGTEDAAYIFANNYKLYIISNIITKVNENSNPYINVNNVRSLGFVDEKSIVRIRSKYVSDTNIEQITEADIVILIPDYYEIISNVADYSKLLYFDEFYYR